MSIISDLICNEHNGDPNPTFNKMFQQWNPTFSSKKQAEFFAENYKGTWAGCVVKHCKKCGKYYIKYIDTKIGVLSNKLLKRKIF